MDPRIAEVVDRERILDTVNELFLATDRKDWPAVQRVFAERVEFDMGGGASAKTPAEIAAGWKEGLAAVDQLHHQTGNFVVKVDDNRASVFCYGIALHQKKRKDGRNTRTFVGSYDFGMVRRETEWRIASFRFNLKFIDGNAELERPET